jgi:lipopolysaccharide/colanic/teichoic acid biosynthesis glycosyltransferase
MAIDETQDAQRDGRSQPVTATPSRRSGWRVAGQELLRMRRRQPLAYRTIKRTIDIVVSFVALVVFAVPLLVIAALIWLDDRTAPILFRQKRTGLGGKRFDVLKFRTMVKNADELKEQLRDQSLVPWPDFRIVNDPRVTKIGRFLRKTSLDELPQLWNVLRGDMSLVGPRPTSFDHSTYDLWHTGRLDFRPGVTGAWQVWGRDSMDFEERCRLEIRFFRKPSILAELKLLVATVPVIFRRTGAA